VVARQDAPGRLGQDHEQIELLARQVEFGLADPDAARVGIDLHVPDHEGSARLAIAPAAPQHGPNPRDHLRAAERLYDVIVGTQLKPTIRSVSVPERSA
jgi:hypothetical protein